MGNEDTVGISEVCYRLKPGVLTVPTPAEEVLMDYDSGKYFGLRGPIMHLVDLLRAGSDFAAMSEALQTVYDADQVSIEGDLRVILKKLVEADLVRTN